MGRRIAALTRHADYQQLTDTPSAHQPFPLTPTGIEQARTRGMEFSQTLQQQDWHLYPKIHSSQLLRAWQTATHFIEAFPAETYLINSFDELAERGLGSVANLSVTQIEKILHEDPRYDAPPPDWKSDSLYRLPLQGAESHLDAGERVAEHIQNNIDILPDDERDWVLLFVGHGAAFRHAAYILDILSLEQVGQLSMHHAATIFIELLEDGSWKHVGGEWKVRSSQDVMPD